MNGFFKKTVSVSLNRSLPVRNRRTIHFGFLPLVWHILSVVGVAGEETKEDCLLLNLRHATPSLGGVHLLSGPFWVPKSLVAEDCIREKKKKNERKLDPDPDIPVYNIGTVVVVVCRLSFSIVHQSLHPVFTFLYGMLPSALSLSLSLFSSSLMISRHLTDKPFISLCVPCLLSIQTLLVAGVSTPRPVSSWRL